MVISQVFEDIVPVGSTKVGLGLELSDFIKTLVIASVHDSVDFLNLEGTSKEGFDFKEVSALVEWIVFEGSQDFREPFEGVLVSRDPVEVDLLELGILSLFDLVSNGLQDGTKRSDTDTSSDKHGGLELTTPDLFGGSSVRSVDSEDRVSVIILGLVFLDNSKGSGRVQKLPQLTSPISDDSNVNADRNFLRSRRDGERMPFLLGNIRTVQEEVLTRLVLEVSLSHLQFNDSRWMGNSKLKDGVLVSSPDSDASFDSVSEGREDDPIPKGDQTKDLGASVDTQKHEEDNEEMVSVPKHIEHRSSDIDHGTGED